MGWREFLDKLDEIQTDPIKKASADLRDNKKARRGVYETESSHTIGPILLQKAPLKREGSTALATDTAERIKEKHIVANTADIHRIIERLAERHNDLVCLRITGRSLNLSLSFNSFSGFFKSLAKCGNELINSVRSMPEKEELLKFISEVKQTTTLNVQEEDKATLLEWIKPLVEAVNDLASAMELVPKLIEADNRLTRHPFSDHDELKSLLVQLYKIYETENKSIFFNKLDKKNNHPLNQTLWEKYYNGLSADLDDELLPKLKKFYEKYLNEIETAVREKGEMGLTPVAKLDAFSAYIENKFSYKDETKKPATISFSRRYHKLKDMIGDLKNKRQKRIDDVKREAEELFDSTKRQFENWRRDLIDFQNALTDPASKGLAFPWKIFPPSKREVLVAKARVNTYREKFKDWESARLIFDDRCTALPRHDFILGRMKAYGRDRIEEALDFKNYKSRYKAELPYQTLQIWINSYKEFLFNTMTITNSGPADDPESKCIIDPEALDIIDNMERRLFLYAHRQIKNQQWFGLFGIFKSTFWKPNKISQIGWSDIISHANGGNKHDRYTGKRSYQTLGCLGWLQKSDKLNPNDKVVPKEFTKEWGAYKQAKLNAQSTFTGKTSLLR